MRSTLPKKFTTLHKESLQTFLGQTSGMKESSRGAKIHLICGANGPSRRSHLGTLGIFGNFITAQT
jgi:hypothetical protein